MKEKSLIEYNIISLKVKRLIFNRKNKLRF